MHRSGIPLRGWFLAMWLCCTQKTGLSASGLQRELGLGSDRSAWLMLHKLRSAMVRSGREPLAGTVEVDEAYMGGPEEGVGGRQLLKKCLVVIAVELNGDKLETSSAGSAGGTCRTPRQRACRDSSATA